MDDSYARLKAGARNRTETIGRLIGATGLTPNMLTVFGLLLNCGAAALILAGSLVAGGIVFLLASAFDMLDGAVARATGSASAFGAFLDSTLDRYSEGVVFAALIAVFAARGEEGHALGAALALTGSLLVSYARARAEGLGLECEVGLLQRPERVVILGLGLLVPGLLLEAVVWFLAVVTNVTVLQRVLHVRRLLAERSGDTARVPRHSRDDMRDGV